MEKIRREGATAFLKQSIAWPHWLAQRGHASLFQQPMSFPKVTWGAGSDHIFPSGTPAPSSRNDMIKSQVFRPKAIATILARKAVAKEHVEAGERRLTV